MSPGDQVFADNFTDDDRLSWAERTLAFSIGAAVPLVAVGIAATQALMALSVIVSLFLFWRESRSRALFLSELTNPLTAAVAVMFLVWIFVSFFSQEIWESMKVVMRMAGIFLGALVIWAQLAERPRVRELALKILLVTGFLALLIAVLAFLLPRDMSRELLNANNSTYYARALFKRFASAAMLMAPVMLWVGWMYRGRYLWLGLGGAGLTMALILMSHSRSPIAGIMASALAICLLLALTRHRLAKWGLMITAFIVAISLAGVAWIRSLSTDLSTHLPGTFLPEWLLDSHRQLIWKFTLEKYTEHPLVGWGINTIDQLPGAQDIIPKVGGVYISSHPHNWIVEVLAEAGIIGLLALLAVLLLLARNLIGQYLKTRSLSVLVACALCAAYVASSLFNYSVWSSWWQMCFLSLLALVLAHGYRPHGPKASKKPRALITVTEDWAFLRHRRPTAQALANAGADVYVVANNNGKAGEIEAQGYHFIEWGVDRGSMNPLKEWEALHRLARIYAQWQPDIVYNVALKPILYGTIGALLCTKAKVVNLFSGLGVLFISQKLRHLGVRAVVLSALRYLFASKRVWLMVQNTDDQKFLNAVGVSDAQKTIIIPGSGIDLENYPLTPEPAGSPVALVVSRMLWDKGIGEVVEAARILKAEGVDLKIRLIGAPDPSNPASIAESQLKAWHDEGVVEWLGQQNDIARQLSQAHIGLLASYREGMPRSLLEAAATGRALVAFDAPGCRDLVRDGENGLLVALKDASALANALKILANDPPLRARMGAAARKDAETIYAGNVITSRLQGIFSGLLKPL